MLVNMLKFEWRYFIRQRSFVVTMLLFFLLPYLSMAVENIQIGEMGNTHFNSPYAIAQSMVIFSFFSVFLVVNFVANTAIRNDITQMSELLYTKPLHPFTYQFGRFLGAYLVILCVSAMVPLGLLIGSFMPWLDQQRMGEFQLLHYVAPFFIFTVPTSFTLSALFYAVALRFRSMMPVYLFALALIVLFSVASAVFSEPHQQGIMSVADVFALTAFFDTTQYWTPSQRNNEIVVLSGYVLYNRAAWIILGVGILLLFSRLFTPLSIASNKDSKTNTQENSRALSLQNEIAYKYQKGAGLKQFTARTAFEVKQVVLSPAFIILLLIGAFMVVAEFVDPAGFYGAPNWPLTQYMVELIRNGFSFSLLIVITYYTAEVVWRERTTGIGDIVDSMPVHNFTFWFSKLIAVCVVILSLFAVGMLATLANQLGKGYTFFDIRQYFISLLYFNALFWILLTVLAFFIQALSPNKYMGMLFFVGYYFIARTVLVQIGFEHNMFHFGQSPNMMYSDMNGYGWSLTTQHYYMLYWLSLSMVLATFSYAMWQRGPDTNLKNRLSILGYSLGRVGQTAVVFGIVGFISLGTVIHYNTRVTNEFLSKDTTIDLQVAYEQTFSQFENYPVPTVTAVDLEAAIFPTLRKIQAIATMNIVNNTDKPIAQFLVNYPSNSTIEIEGAEVSEYNAKFKTAWLSLTPALAPGDSALTTIKVTRQHFGFKDGAEDTSLVKNGTFINNYALFPSFGVNTSYYINDPHERRKNNLPPPKRAYKLEDSSRYNESFFGSHIGPIDFKAKLSTSDDQIAIAPGYLKKYWTDGGRNYFIYEMDSPMIHFYNIMSADLEVSSDRYKGVDITVYYHRTHAWNVERMIQSSKDSLDLYSDAFGPYQHKQLRIIEFPGYRQFAQSFANTVPYSERIGFITDLRDPDIIDPVYYVTAHEVAHQWFGHQLNAANVQGSQILSESLSQYAALLVMRENYGDILVRKFLSYELDRYLRGRANEYLEELPFMRAENQDYIHYRKGAIVLMAIADRIGYDTLNAAIKTLIEEDRYSSDKLPTTLDLLAAIKLLAPPTTHAFIEQQFSQITLYNLKMESADQISDEENALVTRLSLEVSAAQYEANGKGDETPQSFDDMVDITVFSGNPDDLAADAAVLYHQKHRLTDGSNTVTITFDNANTENTDIYVGVDAFIRYIDRDHKDNIIKVR
ncbi:MAG: M1 family aminopeptidase [Glaciecola sp.]